MLKFAILLVGALATTPAVAQPHEGFKPTSVEVSRLREQNLALREEMGRLQLDMLINETLDQDFGKPLRSVSKGDIQRVAMRR